MSKIFLSHTSKDKPFVRRLANDLRRYGYMVWIDEAEINVGDSLIGKIREGLDRVDYVIAVLSKASINSEWVQKEIDIASNREIEEKRVFVLPILIENITPPGFLKGKLYADFSCESQYDNKFQLLLRSLNHNNSVIERKKKNDELVEEMTRLMKRGEEKMNTIYELLQNRSSK